MTEPINNASGVSQADYMKLFMQELTYQDPLKPVDNREFMAQMAQFSSLQEARATNEHLKNLLGMNSGTQSLMLLGKVIRLKDSEGFGEVKSIEFSQEAAPKLSVLMDKGGRVNVSMEQIVEVIQK